MSADVSVSGGLGAPPNPPPPVNRDRELPARTGHGLGRNWVATVSQLGGSRERVREGGSSGWIWVGHKKFVQNSGFETIEYMYERNFVVIV